MNGLNDVPVDPQEAARFICARIDALVAFHEKTLGEIADMQATINVTLACVKTLMSAQGIGLRQEPTPDAERAWAQLEADCIDAHTLYHTEAIKRVETFDFPLVVAQEKPDSEH